MKKIFVSGCYDILHAGHLQFFEEARALGDFLIVSFASAEVLWHHKRRKPSIPDDHKRALLAGLRMVDEVVVTSGTKEGLDFEEDFLRLRPDVLAVTEDDKYSQLKRDLCAAVGARYVVLAKTPPRFEPISTSSIVRWVQAPQEAPLRIDFAGGWLDVPRFARDGAFVVNCAIAPLVSLREWPYERNAGLGGSGAWALLNGKDGIDSELELGVGWQDPAVIRETGCCVWRSGPRPVLDFKRHGDFLAGRLAIFWTGLPHDTPGVADHPRDYDRIADSGLIARTGVLEGSLDLLADGMRLYHEVQLAEGMEPLPDIPNSLGRKYCGGGYGGYACRGGRQHPPHNPRPPRPRLWRRHGALRPKLPRRHAPHLGHEPAPAARPAPARPRLRPDPDAGNLQGHRRLRRYPPLPARRQTRDPRQTRHLLPGSLPRHRHRRHPFPTLRRMARRRIRAHDPGRRRLPRQPRLGRPRLPETRILDRRAHRAPAARRLSGRRRRLRLPRRRSPPSPALGAKTRPRMGLPPRRRTPPPLQTLLHLQLPLPLLRDQ
jgi:cytidyltransferase-like protein